MKSKKFNHTSFDSSTFSDSKQNGATDLTTYNEETLDLDINSAYKEIRLSIGDSSSNDNTLGGSPPFFKITRSPFALALQKRIFGSLSDDSPIGLLINKNFSTDDQIYILDTIFDRTYLRTEEQDYYSKTLYNSPVLNNDPNFIKSDELIDYRYLWDVVSFPNKKLFPNGVNLLIIDIESDDVTNDITIIFYLVGNTFF